MSVTMTCKRCGAEMTASAVEVIKWDVTHDEVCPALNEQEADDER